MSHDENFYVDYREISRQLDVIIFHLQRINPIIGSPFDAAALLQMPDHLRKTALTIIKLGRCTAEEIAAITHRARAVESAYSNQLANRFPEQVKKERVGRKVFFLVIMKN